MGVTIHYRGGITDLTQIEDFENRVLDLAISLGGTARIWRSSDSTNPRRIMRGLIVNLAPGQESASLLISPEGWLTNLTEIEEAERGGLAAPSWCCVKTQFGSVEGHVALIEMFRTLKENFLHNLDIRDEGEYWEKRDAALLANRMGLVNDTIQRLSAGLTGYGLSAEAAEDPEIVAVRIARVASLVHRTLANPSDHGSDGMPSFSPDDADTRTAESRWDEIERFRRRTQERLQRTIQERLAQGDGIDEAVRGALRDAGLPTPDQIRFISRDELEERLNTTHDDFDSDQKDEDVDQFEEFSAEADHDLTSSMESPFSLDPEYSFDVDAGKQDASRNPLLQRSTELYLRAIRMVQNLPKTDSGERPINAGDSLMQGLGDLNGGLAQALFSTAIQRQFEDKDDEPSYLSNDWDESRFPTAEARAMAIVQLKRALRGATFALGAIGQFDSHPDSLNTEIQEIRDTLEALGDGVHQALSEMRQEAEDEEVS